MTKGLLITRYGHKGFFFLWISRNSSHSLPRFSSLPPVLDAVGEDRPARPHLTGTDVDDRAGLTSRGCRAEIEDLAGLVALRLFALRRSAILSL